MLRSVGAGERVTAPGHPVETPVRHSTGSPLLGGRKLAKLHCQWPFLERMNSNPKTTLQPGMATPGIS